MFFEERLTKKRTNCAFTLGKLRGLTLAELLVLLLVSSVIMVTLAPIVRKKDTGSTTTSATNRKYGSILYKFDSTYSECTKSTSDNTLKCNFKVPKGVKYINAIMVSGGGGGAGATTAGSSGTTTKTQTSASQMNIPIVAGMQNVQVKLVGGGGGGGGGNWSKNASSEPPKSQSDCNPYNAKYLTATQNGGKAACVTKYNIGDITMAPNKGIAVSAGVKVLNIGQTCNSGQACCWSGATSRDRCDSRGGSAYSGCNRTACNWTAADTSCKKLAYNGTNAGDWRLPTKDELEAWVTYINEISTGQGNNGLMLCSFNKWPGASYCWSDDVCLGAGRREECWTFHVWSGTNFIPDVYFNFNLNADFLGVGASDIENAMSTRCVYAGGTPTYNSYSGGGGGAGGYISATVPSQHITNSVGGKIVIYAGAGGAGKSSGTAGANGNESYVYVYNSAGRLIWGLKAPGGKGGKGATTSSSGSGGAQNTACKQYNGSSWVSTSCTSAGTAGSSGSSKTGISSSGGGTGGKGANSGYANTGGGSGGTSSSPNGKAASSYGSGGGGATVKVSSGSTTQGTGGKGSNGIVTVRYQISTYGAGGGGGAGGSFASLENIPVNPESTYLVRVGGGGNSGATNNNGGNGGTTSLQYQGGTYTLGGGTGGKIGTTGSTTANIVQGTGGTVGSVNIPSKYVKLGTAGKTGEFASNISSGGNGGKSGISDKFGCGGYNSKDSCNNSSYNATITAFTNPAELHTIKNYGNAGTGGGGGGWKLSSPNNSGGGSQGLSGYVYIYWLEEE